MYMLNRNRWTRGFPAFVAIAFWAPLLVVGQPPQQSFVDSNSPTFNALPTPARELTPEQTGDLLTAHQRYQAAIEAYSQSPQMTSAIWNKMGISYQLMSDSRDAMHCYRQSLKLEPRNPRVLNNLATVYVSMKQLGQADRLYRKALKLQPDNASILKNLGTNLLSEGKYDQGWSAYEKALAADPRIFGNSRNPKVDDPATVKDRGALNYYMALGCVRTGYIASALQYLRAALDEGFTNRKSVAADERFASLRSNQAFQRLLAEPDN